MNTIILQAQSQSNPFSFIILMGGMFLIMYFFMIRPQMKRVKEARKFQESIKTGDRIMTSGGIHGEIIEVGETNVVIKIDQGRMRVEKSAISHDKRVTEGQEKK